MVDGVEVEGPSVWSASTRISGTKGDFEAEEKGDLAEKGEEKEKGFEAEAVVCLSLKRLCQYLVSLAIVPKARDKGEGDVQSEEKVRDGIPPDLVFDLLHPPPTPKEFLKLERFRVVDNLVVR